VETWDAGSSEELHALFSTCSRRLEHGGWGSRFPTLMNELYQGELAAEDVSSARRELAQAREALSDMPPSAVVWDVEDPSRRPPEGEAVDPAITNLSEYFLTNDGQNLIAVIDTALAHAEREHATVTIRATDPASIPEMGLRVGANVWGIGDRSQIAGALATLEERSEIGLRLRDLLADGGLEGAHLAEAHRGIDALRSALNGDPPASLRTQDGRYLLDILDEALAYAVRSGKPARITPVL
jgi:hypothetical protein